MEFKMNGKIVKLAGVIAVSTSLVGCASSGSWKCSIEGGPSQEPVAKCEVSGTWEMQAMRLIRPINTMLAETIGYSFSDWQNSNFNDFAIKLDGVSSTIKNNTVIVKVYDGLNLLGSQSFTVVKVDGQYKFSAPDSVKQWAFNYIDLGSSVKLDFDIAHTDPGTVTVQAKHQNQIKASASAYLPSRSSTSPPIYNEIQ